VKKIVLILFSLIASLASFSQASLVIVGTTRVAIVEHGGTAATPIYIEIANPNATSAANPGIKTPTGTNGFIVSENEYDIVKWDIGTANNGVYTVPFGYITANPYTNAFYLPLTMGISAGAVSGGATPHINFSTWHTQGDNWTGVVSKTGAPSGVNNMHAMWPGGSPNNNDNSYNTVDRFWVINPVNYATAPPVTGSVAAGQSPNLQPGVGIQFTYLDGAVLADSSEVSSAVGYNNVAGMESHLLAQRYNTGTNNWGDWTGSAGTEHAGAVANTGAVWTSPALGTGVTSGNFYKDWTLASSLDPLPITLGAFTAQCNNGTALIQWTSEVEVNNASYTVEKTTDDIHFDVVGIMESAAPSGTSSLPLNYSMTDYSPYSGAYYYILEQTDIDGTTKRIATYQFDGCEATPVTSVNAYNTTNFIEVQINSVVADNFTVSLTNMLGQTILTENKSVALGDNEIRLNNNVAAGIYILNVRNDKVNYSRKMVLGVR